MARKFAKFGGEPKFTTPIRNTPIPKPSTQPITTRGEVTHDMVAKRAYEIYLSGNGGGELENWLRAERELKGQA